MSRFFVKIDDLKDIEDLNEAIKTKNPHTFIGEPDKLDLYLVKTTNGDMNGEWMNDEQICIDKLTKSNVEQNIQKIYLNKKLYMMIITGFR